MFATAKFGKIHKYEDCLFLRASYAVCSWDLFPSWGFLVQLTPSQFPLHKSLQHRLVLLGFLWKMLHWDGLCHQCSVTSKNFCSTCGLYSVFSTRSLQRKKKKNSARISGKLMTEFWAGERGTSKKLQKLELGFFWVMSAILRCFKGDGSHGEYFNNSLPPQTVLNSS